MKLQNLSIRDFKGISNLSFNPEKVNVVIGENGHGKTTLLEAIRYVITGKYPDDSIAIGANECHVSACVNGDNIDIGRKKDKTGEKGLFKVEGKTTSYSSYKTACEARGTAKQMDVAAFATSKELMDMDVDALTEFMLAHTPVQINFDKLISLEPAITQEMADELNNVLPSENITFDNITEADNFFTSQRKVIKDACAAAKAKAVYTGEIPNEKETEESLNKQYEANIGIIAAKKAKSENYRNYCKLVESKAQIELAVKEKEQQAQTLKCERPDDSKVQQIMQSIADIEKDILNFKTVRLNLAKDTELFERTLSCLNSNVCPISEKLICNTDKTVIKTELSEAVESNKLQNANLDVSINNMEEKVHKLVAEKETLEANQKQYEKYIDCLKAIESLKKSIPDIPEKIDEDKTDISQIEFENRVLKAKIENLRKYKEFKVLEKQYLDLCKKRDLYESLCKLLDEKGSLREKILSFALQPFEDYVNDRAKALKICFNVKILAEKGVRILYNPKGGTKYISYNNASTGEKLMIVFLILDMINALSDIRLLFIDNLDKLDNEALDKLVNLINEPVVQNSYDHIFLVGVDHEDSVRTLNKLTNVNFINF